MEQGFTKHADERVGNRFTEPGSSNAEEDPVSPVYPSALGSSDADPYSRAPVGNRAGGSESRLDFHEYPSAVAGESFARSVERGLASNSRWLSCSWFYDERGSELFERICTLDEYYLTRAEADILHNRAEEIVSGWPSDVTMVELGSGSSAKTRTLIDAFLGRQDTLQYCPIDISQGILRSSALSLLETYPRLYVRATAADYLDGLQRILAETSAPRLILFLGSTIGNFSMTQAKDFLTEIRRRMHGDDRLLLGADLRKDRSVIEAAYNDREGVTAAFNKNLLARINRELDGSFELDKFEHRAPYFEAEGRVEMHLVSREAQEVKVGALDSTFSFEAGEVIVTESCHKYSQDELHELSSESGMKIERAWRDAGDLFSLSLLAPL